jgi:hypothetical protein
VRYLGIKLHNVTILPFKYCFVHDTKKQQLSTCNNSAGAREYCLAQLIFLLECPQIAKKKGEIMIKALLSLQEMSEMFNQKTFFGLLSNAENVIDNLNEAEDFSKELSYIFRVMASYCEKVAKNLDSYGRAYERISLSDPRQEALFMAFCYAIGVTVSYDERLSALSNEERVIFNEKIKVVKDTYEELFKINHEMYLYVKNIKKNDVSLFEIIERVGKTCRLIEERSEDKALKDIYYLFLKAVKSFQKKEAISLIEQSTNDISEKAEIKIVHFHSDEKAIFYRTQIECCICIIQNIYEISCMKEQGDDEFVTMLHFMDLTVGLMSTYYDQIEKEYAGQNRFVFAKASSLGKMDAREIIYLGQVQQCLNEMKKNGGNEKPHLEDLPAMAEYTQAFDQFLNMKNPVSLDYNKKARLSA